jgi:molecular chaperone DnaJ
VNLYEVLGVRRGASTAEIRRAYQKLARQLHPDLNPGDPVAAGRFRTVLRAFEILSDPQRRGPYDRGEVPGAPPSVPEVGFAGFDFYAETTTEGVGFQEIFSGVLHRRGGDAETGAAGGEDLEQTVSVTFEEALSGTRRRMQVVRQEACPLCHGAGEVAAAPSPCGRCHGSGQVQATRGRMIFSRRCPDCGGTGATARRGCGRCGGEGRVMHSEWLEAQIPAGVTTGSRVRIPGRGNAGRRGGPAGDFVLTVQVESHPVFRRDADDLYCEVPVTIAEAALGAEVEVPTPDGPVTIFIPAGTQSAQRFRLRKRGAPRHDGKGRGDLFVEIRVWVPSVTDEESRELLREFARRHPGDLRREPAKPGARVQRKD